MEIAGVDGSFFQTTYSRRGGPALTDEERKERAELLDRYPPDPENSASENATKSLPCSSEKPPAPQL